MSTEYPVLVSTQFSWQAPILDKDLTTAPTGIPKGARYILAGTGGGWSAGTIGHIATYTGSAWIYSVPVEGWQAWVVDEDMYYYYTGTGWNTLDISAVSAGLSTATSTNVVQDSNISTLSAGLSSANSVNTVQDSNISTVSAGLSTATSVNTVQDSNISTLSAGLSTATSVNTVQTANISTVSAGLSTATSTNVVQTSNISTLSAGLSTATSVNIVQDSNISTLSAGLSTISGLSDFLDQSVKTTASPTFVGLNISKGPVTFVGNEPFRSVIHGGASAIHVGNDSLGQGRPPVSKLTQSAAISGTRTSASLFTRTTGTWTIEALNDQYAFFYAAAAPTVGNWLQIVKPVVTAEILGTRTSDTIFTRSAGTWTVDALIGRYVFSYVTVASTTIGVWLPIVDNDATTLTVTGVLYAGATAIKTCANDLTTTITVNGIILAAADTVKTCAWLPIQNSYAHGKGADAFYAGVFDGQNIWLVPGDSSDLVKVNTADGSMTSYPHGKGLAGVFVGGVFDGQNIWLVPNGSPDLVKVNPVDGSMTSYPHGKGSEPFRGGIFDGQNVWLVPYTSTGLVKVNPADGSMTSYAHGKGVGAFWGGVFDGQNIWLVPRNSADLVKVNPADGSMTSYAHGQGGNAFAGGVFDGQNIWLVPRDSTNLVKVNPADGSMTSYAHGKGSNAFWGGVFDGQSIWLIPSSSVDLVKVNPTDGSMTSYAHGKGTLPFTGGVFDGQNIWLVPGDSSDLVSFRPTGFGRVENKKVASLVCETLKVAGNEPIRSIVHGGASSICAGNNGLGQGRPPVSKITQSDAIAGTRTSASLFTRTAGTWTIEALNDQYAFFYAAAAPTVGNWLQIVKPAASAEILGTRTSDTIFTRTTGTWTPDELIGQYVFSYVTATATTIGVWLPIVDNDATTLTVTGVLYAGATAIKTCANDLTTTITVNGTILAAADTVKTCAWLPIQWSIAHGKGSAAFIDGVFDGQNIWLVPQASTDLVKVNPADGTMTSYAHGKGIINAFAGGVFDGQNIWLIPYSSPDLVKVNPSDGTMTPYAHGKGTSAFWGGVFDGQNIWLVPCNSADLVKVNPADGSMTSYAHGKGTSAFQGGVFDGQNVWLIPRSSDLVKVNPADGSMTSYAHGKGSNAFTGGVFDGQNIWLAPYQQTSLVKVNPADGSMTSYSGITGTYNGICFDGQNLWLVPRDANDIVKVNPSDGSKAYYAHGKGASAFIGGVFDGQNVWLVPRNSVDIVSFRPIGFGHLPNKRVSSLYSEGGLTVDTNTLAVDAVNHRVGIGTTAPEYLLELSSDQLATPFYISAYTDVSATAPNIVGRRAKGTRAAPTQVVAGNTLVNVVGRGYFTGASAGWSGSVGIISIKAAESFSPTAQGTYVGFWTTPIGSTVSGVLERIRISDDGSVGINYTAKTHKFSVNGTCALGDGGTTNYAQFAADGELTLLGTARVNKIINLGITGLASGSVAPTVARVGNYYGYQFTSINDAGYVGSFEIPYDWDSTTAITFKIHWYANNTSAAKMIQWQVDYNATAENTEQVNAATTTLTTGDLAVSTTAYRLTKTEITIAAANLAFDDVMAIMVKRIAASGGAGVVPDNPPVIVSLEIEYVSNKLGEAT